MICLTTLSVAETIWSNDKEIIEKLIETYIGIVGSGRGLM
jgi:hypothetical protein